MVIMFSMACGMASTLEGAEKLYVAGAFFAITSQLILGGSP